MTDERPAKRSKFEHINDRNGRRDKQAGKWKTHQARSAGKVTISASGIHNDDVGIFVTCDKGHERKCLTEVHDLLTQYLDKETTSFTGTEGKTTEAKGLDDVEADIQAELNAMKAPEKPDEKLKLITLDIPCVSFVKLGPGIDPVGLVTKICTDAFNHPNEKRSRYIKRMTPMSLMRKILSDGLEELCESVLKPHFHSGGQSKKFAIRPTIRNNNQLDRDTVINKIAKAVGSEHKVDLKGYDLLIIVDIYRNVCGMSVVGNDFEKLKKYNIAEIYQPTPVTAPKAMSKQHTTKDAEIPS